MEQYINKSTVVAELKRRLKEYRTYPEYQIDSNYMELCEILSFLNTIEVKEVDEEYNGKAMLHVLEKGVKQGKRDMIDKACEWLKDNWRKHVWLDGDNIIHFGLWENDFRKAMEE